MFLIKIICKLLEKLLVQFCRPQTTDTTPQIPDPRPQTTDTRLPAAPSPQIQTKIAYVMFLIKIICKLLEKLFVQSQVFKKHRKALESLEASDSLESDSG